MHQLTARIARLTARPDGHILAEFAAPLPAESKPGQFYLAHARERYLRLPLFPETASTDGLTVELPPDLAHLLPGDELDLVGPCGRGLALPERARNVLLIAGPAGPARLRSFAHAALARRASVVLLCDAPQRLPDLPPEIEVRFGAAGLSDALGWADALYADLPPAALGDLQRRHCESAANGERLAGPVAHAFRIPPAPCGVGACGACAVPTTRGWRLACVDGPCFDLLDLEL